MAKKDNQKNTSGNKLGFLFALSLTLAIGILIGWKGLQSSPRKSVTTIETGATMLKPGPWGTLSIVPIEIAPPVELLPVQSTADSKIIWIFENYTSEQLKQFLVSLDVSASQLDQMLGDNHLVAIPNGVQMTPSPDAVLSLSPKARLAIYKVLAGSGLNDSVRIPVLQADVDKQFGSYGVSKETIALFKNVSCPYKKYLVCYCLPLVLSKIPTYDEKTALYKAIARSKTMLVRIHIGPDSDINDLNSYWGKAFWSTDVKSILESLSHLPDGSWLDMVELLPPLPTSLIYNYPMPQSNVAGAEVRRDCHWTSMNFFRDPPDDNFQDSNYVLQKLKDNYFPITSDPRYGDVLLFVTPDGRGIHSAVYIADNIVFTRNGNGSCMPWIFSTVDDLLDLYDFTLPEGQTLKINYYRNKYY